MDIHIIDELRKAALKAKSDPSAPGGLTAKELVSALKSKYPDAERLKTSINSLLFGQLKKSGRVEEVKTDKPAPLWKLKGRQVTFIDLQSGHPVEAFNPPLSGELRYFGPTNHPNAPAGAILADNYVIQMAMAVEKEKCLGSVVSVVSDNAMLQGVC